jgi:hypothetical protein
MDCVLTSSEVDLGLPHSLDYLYKGYDGLCARFRKSFEDNIYGYISMSNCFPSVIVRWILNFMDQTTHENHENWYPTNKSDFMFIESCMYKSVLGKINKLQKKKKNS